MQFVFLGALMALNRTSRGSGGAMATSIDDADQWSSPAARGDARQVALTPPSDRERVFAAARRRSSRVGFLRKAILVGVLGTVAAMILIAVFNPFSTKLRPLSFSNLSLDGSKITMAKPKLAGFRSDGQAYVLTAETALQDIKQPTIVELQKVEGDIGMAGGETTHVSADSGVYDSAAERMRLIGDVRIGNASFEVRLRSAAIDFKTGLYQSDEPVEVHMGDGTTILGDRAMARDNGRELTFEGHVKTRIAPHPDAADADAKRTNP